MKQRGRYITATLALLIFVFNKHVYSQIKDMSGIAFSVSNANSVKLFPKVSLQSLDSYSPIIGVPTEGLMVENDNLSPEKGLLKDIYIWASYRWQKLLNFSDIKDISPGTHMLYGDTDPNILNDIYLLKAPKGSIYINTLNKKFYKKEFNNSQKWIAMMSLDTDSLTSGKGIEIENNKIIHVKAGQGIKLDNNGISLNLEDTNPLVFNSKGELELNTDENTITKESGVLRALPHSALWNAKKLQGIDVIKDKNASLGNLLVYNGSIGAWQQQSGMVSITGSDIILDSLDTLQKQSKHHNMLMITRDGKLVKSPDILWGASGNDNIDTSNGILGITDSNSTTGLSINTQNRNRVIITSEGDIFLPGIAVSLVAEAREYKKLVIDSTTREVKMVPDPNKEINAPILTNLLPIGLINIKNLLQIA